MCKCPDFALVLYVVCCVSDCCNVVVSVEHCSSVQFDIGLGCVVGIRYICVIDDSKWGILHENKGLGETFVKNKPVCRTFR